MTKSRVDELTNQFAEQLATEAKTEKAFLQALRDAISILQDNLGEFNGGKSIYEGTDGTRGAYDS